MSISLNSPFKSSFNTGRFAPVGKYGDFPGVIVVGPIHGRKARPNDRTTP